ncbi:MAG: hypothetical protein WCO60_08965 [Verrucomicrobiota bacterium]
MKTTISTTSVFCIAKSKAQVENIITQLNASGFAYPDISVLMPDAESAHDIGHVKSSKAPEGAATGAATGGLAGGVLGLLAGVGALAIPGVGALIAAGPILGALSGAAVGATTGGIVGGLIGLGIPELEAKIYEEKLKTGNYVIAVHTHDEAARDRVKEIFKAGEAQDIASTRELAVPTH